MLRVALIGLAVVVGAPAWAQSTATLGDSAKAVIGNWEFSNADRDKICTATFKSDPSKVGFKVEFDANCPTLFALVSDVAGWNFPDNDLLRLLDAQGKALVEFSEVEDGIYEAPTPGVGVLFLQKAGAAGPPPKLSEQVAGNWAIMRGSGKLLCSLTLATTPLRDDLALTVKPGCDAAIVRVGFTQWRMDRGELVLVSTRGISWRFEEVDSTTWRRLPESADPVTLVRQ
ncbi:MAG: AprI/Inh family metalloprotease inhibitor [Rhizobiales bacterium]|nr:AprI/Inh family metalloprotease inhibitor [Hyphomicrobiales bacterium]